MEYRVQLVFDVLDFECDPSEISEMLGLTAQAGGKRGDLLVNGLPRRRSTWHFYSKASCRDADIDEHFDDFKEVLFTKVASINTVLQTAKLKITVLVDISDRIVPSLYLRSDFIKFCSDINCEVDFDFYSNDDD